MGPFECSRAAGMRAATAKFRSRLTDRFLNALHYPVARTFAHYYPNYEGEVVRFLRMIMRHCERQSIVLDAGCGRAGFAIPWQQFSRSVIGVDISPKIGENPWVGHKIRGNLYQLPLVDGSVDVAILRYVLEHLEWPVEALREVARVVRPRGKIIVLTPNRAHYVCLIARVTPHSFHGWFLARHGRFDEDVSPTRYRANTPPGLRAVASQAGLRLVELELFEAAPWYLSWFWPAFLMGVAYERVVNRFRALAGLRVSMLAALEKVA